MLAMRVTGGGHEASYLVNLMAHTQSLKAAKAQTQPHGCLTRSISSCQHEVAHSRRVIVIWPIAQQQPKELHVVQEHRVVQFIRVAGNVDYKRTGDKRYE